MKEAEHGRIVTQVSSPMPSHVTLYATVTPNSSIMLNAARITLLFNTRTSLTLQVSGMTDLSKGESKKSCLDNGGNLHATTPVYNTHMHTGIVSKNLVP